MSRQTTTSSSSPPATRRSEPFWTRWRRSLKEKLAAHRQAKWERRLGPALFAMMVPVAAAMQRLQAAQEQQADRIRELLQEIKLGEELTALLMEVPSERTVRLLHLETRDLLTEVLQTLQPPPEQALWEQLGQETSTLPSSLPSSES